MQLFNVYIIPKFRYRALCSLEYANSCVTDVQDGDTFQHIDIITTSIDRKFKWMTDKYQVILWNQLI